MKVHGVTSQKTVFFMCTDVITLGLIFLTSTWQRSSSAILYFSLARILQDVSTESNGTLATIGLILLASHAR
jgi:hypothetical protein